VARVCVPLTALLTMVIGFACLSCFEEQPTRSHLDGKDDKEDVDGDEDAVERKIHAKDFGLK
jgi:hypothetical protein